MSDSNLLKEIHRRSVWQVLSVYVASAWGVVGVVDFFTDQVGLPDWTPTMALVLLLIGLPIVIATAVVQGGVRKRAKEWPEEARDAEAFGDDASSGDSPGTQAGSGTSTRARIFSWKNARRGAAVAASLMVVSVGGYLLSWSTGIGPVGNLVAQGVLEAGDPILLAEFENTADDEELGRIVTEALRVDLSSSEQLELVDRRQVENILELMTVDGEAAIQGQLAEEVAARGGIKAIVEGSVGKAGSGYILVASIRATATGETVSTFRRTASSDDDLISAIDGLSQDIRERAGESLRDIRGDAPLEAVTTASLPALRLYSEAQTVNDAGDPLRAIDLAREAVALDPEFAMAHRFLAVVLTNRGIERAAAAEAAERAYELGDRLTPRERLLAEAYWKSEFAGDPLGAIEAYEEVLDRFPDNATALNNLALQYLDFGRTEEAVALLERAIEGPGASRSAWSNLPNLLIELGEIDRADEVLQEAGARYPETDLLQLTTDFVIALHQGDWSRAEAGTDVALALPDLDGDDRFMLGVRDAILDGTRGRVEAARTRFRTMTEEARGGEFASFAPVILQMQLALESAWAPDRVTPHLREMYRIEVVETGRIAGPELVGVADALLVNGLQAEFEDVSAGVLNQFENSPVAGLVPPLRESWELARERPAPSDLVAAMRRIEARINCGNCRSWIAAWAAMEGGMYEEAADLYATSQRPGMERRVGTLSRMEERFREAEAAEAAGDSTRAIRALREAIALADDPDAEGQARIDEIEARITALGG